jgi:hypothetical protein
MRFPRSFLRQLTQNEAVSQAIAISRHQAPSVAAHILCYVRPKANIKLTHLGSGGAPLFASVLAPVVSFTGYKYHRNSFSFGSDLSLILCLSHCYYFLRPSSVPLSTFIAVGLSMDSLRSLTQVVRLCSERLRIPQVNVLNHITLHFPLAII